MELHPSGEKMGRHMPTTEMTHGEHDNATDDDLDLILSALLDLDAKPFHGALPAVGSAFGIAS